MKKNNIMRKLLIITLFLIFSISLATIARSDLKLSTSDNITDPADDVIGVDMFNRKWKPTDLHSELDIDTMIRSDQDFTITFHATIQTGQYYQYGLAIYEEVGVDTYSVNFMYGNDGYLWGPEGYWTSTGWGYSSLDEIIVGTISGDTVQISIPSEALTIQTSHNWGFMAAFVDESANTTYVDFCPDGLRNDMLEGFSGPSSTIAGYELPILIGFGAIFTIGLIYIYKKQLKSGF